MILQSTPPSFDPLVSIIKPAEQPKPEPKLYVIVEGDVLEKVATAQETTVQRIYDKNTSLVDPNIIEVGQELVIPLPDEQLPSRPLPVQNTPVAPQNGSKRASTPRASSPGNTYYWGQCVWYLKNLRPEIPNSWSNAVNWYSRAKADGWATGATPRNGAIAWAKTGSHVAMVTSFTSTTVTVTEMNARGLGVISSRTTPISQWLYIY